MKIKDYTAPWGGDGADRAARCDLSLLTQNVLLQRAAPILDEFPNGVQVPILYTQVGNRQMVAFNVHCLN